MVGTVDFEVVTRYDRFCMSFSRKYNIIDGNSGTGKTHLVDSLKENKSGVDEIKVISRVDYYVIDKYTDFYGISDDEECLVFIDEDICNKMYMKDRCKELKLLTETKNAYFIFITRLNMATLPISCNCIYYFNTKYSYGTIKEHYLEQRYVWVNESVPTPDAVIVEDRGSGLDFYKRYFDCNVISADGNGNLHSVAQDMVDTGIKTLIIVGDSAGLGAAIKNLIYLKSDCIHKGIKVLLFLPESFEYVLLRSRIFLRFIDKDVLFNTQDYAETSEFVSWERYYTSLVIELAKNYGNVANYSKSKLTSFYLNEKNLKYIADAVDEILEKGR